MNIDYSLLNLEEKAAVEAALTYLARKDRREHPAGNFDSALRWYPDPKEKSPYVMAAREPSRAWPYSRLVAARSLKHCSWLYGLDEKVVRDTVGLLEGKLTNAGFKRMGSRKVTRIIDAIEDEDAKGAAARSVLDVIE